MGTASSPPSSPLDAVASPSRAPSLIHALILLATTTISVMVIAVAGPTVPAMQRHFAGVAGVEFLAPLSISAPLAAMALLCLPAGWLLDRVGRKRPLMVAIALYAMVGSLPLVLDSLHAILASRIALGVLEAVLVTASTTLIGDYYRGKQRVRIMALQGMMGPVAAVVFNYLGGAVGAYGWRAPYGFYLVATLLLPLIAVHLWEPGRGSQGSAAAELATPSPSEPAAIGLRWRHAAVCATAFFGGIGFIVVPVHFAYLFEAIGVHETARIGLAFSLQSLGGIVGAIGFGWLVAPALRVGLQIPAMAALTGAGFVLMQRAGSYEALTLAGMLNGLGIGMLFPLVLNWAMHTVPAARRGVGIGSVQASLSLGMFLSPPLVVGLDQLLGGRGAAVGAIGWAALAVALVILVILWMAGRPFMRPAPADVVPTRSP